MSTVTHDFLNRTCGQMMILMNLDIGSTSTKDLKSAWEEVVGVSEPALCALEYEICKQHAATQFATAEEINQLRVDVEKELHDFLSQRQVPEHVSTAIEVVWGKGRSLWRLTQSEMQSQLQGLKPILIYACAEDTEKACSMAVKSNEIRQEHKQRLDTVTNAHQAWSAEPTSASKLHELSLAAASALTAELLLLGLLGMHDNLHDHESSSDEDEDGAGDSDEA